MQNQKQSSNRPYKVQAVWRLVSTVKTVVQWSASSHPTVAALVAARAVFAGTDAEWVQFMRDCANYAGERGEKHSFCRVFAAQAEVYEE